MLQLRTEGWSRASLAAPAATWVGECEMAAGMQCFASFPRLCFGLKQLELEVTDLGEVKLSLYSWGNDNDYHQSQALQTGGSVRRNLEALLLLG